MLHMNLIGPAVSEEKTVVQCGQQLRLSMGILVSLTAQVSYKLFVCIDA